MQRLHLQPNPNIVTSMCSVILRSSSTERKTLQSSQPQCRPTIDTHSDTNCEYLHPSLLISSFVTLAMTQLSIVPYVHALVLIRNHSSQSCFINTYEYLGNATVGIFSPNQAPNSHDQNANHA